MCTTPRLTLVPLLLLLPLLIAGCCNQPDLQASWHATPQSGLKMVILNSGRAPIRLHRVAIDPDRREGADADVAALVPAEPINLAVGELVTLDVTRFALIEETLPAASGAASEARRLRHCVLPLRLRVSYSDPTDKAVRELKDRSRVDIAVPTLLPPTLPANWEQCGVLQAPGT